eukprot:9121755-Alexandrium_andersonii.AAC.1
MGERRSQTGRHPTIARQLMPPAARIRRHPARSASRGSTTGRGPSRRTFGGDKAAQLRRPRCETCT